MSSNIYHRMWSLAAALVVVLAVVGVARAADETSGKMKGVKVGDTVPGFTMKDLDGKEHSLSEHTGKTVVLVFVSNACPWSRGADPVLSQIAAEYQDKDVVFYGIDPDRENTPEQIQKYNDENKVTYTVLKDEQNRYADALGAVQTPEVFIVDKDGKLVYHGAVDDRKAEAEAGKTNYVRNALDEVTTGKPVTVSEKKQWGCGIRRVAKQDS